MSTENLYYWNVAYFHMYSMLMFYYHLLKYSVSCFICSPSSGYLLPLWRKIFTARSLLIHYYPAIQLFLFFICNQGFNFSYQDSVVEGSFTSDQGGISGIKAYIRRSHRTLSIYLYICVYVCMRVCIWMALKRAVEFFIIYH